MGAVESLEPTLIAVAARCLRVDPAGIHPQAPLARYGLDSLSALELGTAIGDAMGVEVGEDWLLDSPSIRTLAQRVLAQALSDGDRAGTLEQLRADAGLPADIDPGCVAPAAGGSVLLTGGNGFLGVHLVSELLSAGADAVYCPVRAATDAEAKARMRAALARYSLGSVLSDPRLHILAADLGRPLFGLSRLSYEALAQASSTVVHCAADLNWSAPYGALRDINVGATLQLLRFACTATRKRMHFVSSVAACYSTRGGRSLDEDDALPDPEGIHLGYAQTKWAAERLVGQAQQRGLATVTYRPALIGGHSALGLGNDDDLIARLVGGCVALGRAPELDWELDVVPVDFVARAIARLWRDEPTAQRTVHLRNPRPARWNEAMLWLDLHGYRVTLEPFPAWIERVRRETREPDHPLHGLRAFLLARPAGEGGRYLPQLYARPHVSVLHAERSQALLQARGVQCPRVGSNLLGRYAESWSRAGVLPAPARMRLKAIAPAPEHWSALLQAALRAHFGEPGLSVRAATVRGEGSDHSLLAELASWGSPSALSLHARTLDVVRTDGRASTLELMLKPKPATERLLTLTAEVASRCDPALGTAFEAYGAMSEFAHCGERELAVYAGAERAVRATMPVCFGTIELGGVPVLLLERVRDAALIDSVDTPERWSAAYVQAALEGGARIHARGLGRGAALARLHEPGKAEADAAASGRWFAALSAHASAWLRPWLGDAAARAHAELARTWQGRLQAALELPRTLVHNDFNPRNIALRNTPLGARLCAFDWELAAYDLPQRDLAELLCFVLMPQTADRAAGYVEDARLALERASRRTFDTAGWHRGMRIALADFGVRRLPMYFIAHRFRPQPFLQRVAHTWWQLTKTFGTLA